MPILIAVKKISLFMYKISRILFYLYLQGLSLAVRLCICVAAKPLTILRTHQELQFLCYFPPVSLVLNVG